MNAKKKISYKKKYFAYGYLIGFIITIVSIYSGFIIRGHGGSSFINHVLHPENPGMGLAYIGQLVINSSLIASIAYFFGKYRDIHEILVEQNKIIKMNHHKLLEQNKAKNEFINTSSHELKTPLTNIKAYIQIMLDGDLGKLTKDQEKFLTVIKRNVDELIKIVESIIALTKLKVEETKLNIRNFSLNKVITEVIASREHLARVRNIKIKQSIPSHFFVKADEHKLRIILTNLLDNAIKFSLDNGNIVFDANQKDKKAIISIQDFGLGIEKENLKKIFNRYYQSPSTLKQAHAGYGVGLSIAKKLVEQHKGKMWVKSELNKGSTFYVSLQK